MTGRSRDELGLELLSGVQPRGPRILQFQVVSWSGGALPSWGHHADPDLAELERPGDAENLLVGQWIAEDEYRGGESGGPVRIRTHCRE